VADMGSDMGSIEAIAGAPVEVIGPVSHKH
jgi:hypothetical protein